MAKTKEETFLLSEYSNKELTILELVDLKIEYDNHIIKTPSKLPNINVIETMLWAKRVKIDFGPKLK